MSCKQLPKGGMERFAGHLNRVWETETLASGPCGMGNLWTPDGGPVDQIVSDGTEFPLRGLWPNTIFETPNNCTICLQTMYWAEKTVCRHVFHLHCVMRHMNTNNTCPICKHSRPLLCDSDDDSEEMEEEEE
ncbi:hypothetical protein NPIL_231071 [Nephila pilipes]|uniref:RING-type domain-containing protein n=1 Tax=Nephila pilipes TaxID=299642 RepID=A0A8X6UMX0_NEPPI|nr:hypothetical protein NPIL_231071 [Nephila pilipes]